MTKKKFLLSAAFIMVAVSSVFAQGNGIGGITEATNMVTSYFDPGTKLIYAIGAVVGLIGGASKCIISLAQVTQTPQKQPLRGSVRVSSLSWLLPFYALSSCNQAPNK